MEKLFKKDLLELKESISLALENEEYKISDVRRIDFNTRGVYCL